MFRRIKKHFNSIPEGKRYIEVFTALLSVPVLLTVVYTNYLNLQDRNRQNSKPEEKIVVVNGNQAQNTNPTPESCKKKIGPISIAYPSEGATIDEDPVNIIISYDKEEYCSVVWSYRVNNGAWSQYSSNSISLYNMTNGDKKLELRVQSTVTDEQTILTRSFKYEGATPFSTPTDSN